MAFVLCYNGGKFTLSDDVTQSVIISTDNINEAVAAADVEKPLTVFIDAEEFYIRKALFPKIGAEKVKDILPVEMEGRFIVPAKELFFELLFLKEEEGGDSYLVFALNRQFLINMLLPLLNKGVKITAVSINNAETISELIKELDLSKVRELNFFPKELVRFSEKKVTFGIVKKIVVYVAALCLIIITGLSLRLYFLKKKEMQLKKDIVVRYNTIFPEAKSANIQPSIVQAKLMELKQSYRALKGVELLETLKDISVQVNNVTVKEVNIDNGRLTIKGEGKDYASVEQYKVALRKSLFNINIAETKNLSDGRLTFVMEAIVAD